MNLNLHLEEVSSYEVMQILLQYFHHAESYEESAYKYTKSDSADKYITFNVDKKGDIIPSTILLSDKISQVDCSQIEREIIENLINNQIETPTQYIVFCDYKVNGYFKYKEMFQLIPVPQNAPRHNGYGNNPLLLQFKYIRSKSESINYARRIEKIHEYVRLLNLLLNGGIYLSHRQYRAEWVFNLDQEDISSEYRQLGYTFKDNVHDITQWSALAGISEINKVPHNDYYSFEPQRSMESLLIPDNLTELIDKYFSLSGDNILNFKKALYWHYTYHKFKSESDSGSYAVLISAIESLLDHSSKKCDCCGQEIFQITKRFRDFINKYAFDGKASSKYKKELDNLYSYRSKFVHGLDVFKTDLSVHIRYSISPIGAVEWTRSSDLFLIISIALLNWLQESK